MEPKPKKAYKLLRLRKDGSLGSLFINRRKVLEKGKWYDAEDHPTKGYAHRPGWHCTDQPYAPHLKMEGRVWLEVMVQDYETIKRPESQGGIWYLAKRLKLL